MQGPFSATVQLIGGPFNGQKITVPHPLPPTYEAITHVDYSTDELFPKSVATYAAYELQRDQLSKRYVYVFSHLKDRHGSR